jgi:hypothetical protein
MGVKYKCRNFSTILFAKKGLTGITILFYVRRLSGIPQKAARSPQRGDLANLPASLVPTSECRDTCPLRLQVAFWVYLSNLAMLS